MIEEQRMPMTEAMYYVLLALWSPLHGYAVMDEIKKASNGRVVMGPGTLYGILKRLEKEGLILLEDIEGRRKIYQITARGKKALQQEYERLAEMVYDGKSLLKGENKDEE